MDKIQIWWSGENIILRREILINVFRWWCVVHEVVCTMRERNKKQNKDKHKLVSRG